MAVESSAQKYTETAKKDRDELLDDLKKANEEFYKQESKRIDVEEEYLIDILRARGAAMCVAKASAQKSKVLLVNDIASFSVRNSGVSATTSGGGAASGGSSGGSSSSGGGVSMQPVSGSGGVVNLSSEQTGFLDFDPPHHRLVKDKLTGKTTVLSRNPLTVDGIVIHQTGIPFGVSKDQVRAAGGDPVLAKHRRALNVAAHMTAFDTGFAVLAHPLTWYVYHGNSLNARSLGLEIEGLYPGIMGTAELLKGPILEAAKNGLKYLVTTGRAAGMPIKYIWAHRQASLTRTNDPGQEIWRKIVMDYAPSLGLQTQDNFVSGGQSIPASWKAPLP